MGKKKKEMKKKKKDKKSLRVAEDFTKGSLAVH